VADPRRPSLAALAELIEAVERPHPVRVAIDGPDAAGKTTLADELANELGARGRTVLRASIDGFHRPRAERYRRGRDSPEGYYREAFDYEAVRSEPLEPLGPDGDRRYRAAVFDLGCDARLRPPRIAAPADAILVADGVFLQRLELAALWDFRVFAHAEAQELLCRACERDAALFGSAEAVRERYERRYLAGQRLYVDEVGPRELADVVVDNTHTAAPALSLKA
jgi:uridine kinase